MKWQWEKREWECICLAGVETYAKGGQVRLHFQDQLWRMGPWGPGGPSREHSAMPLRALGREQEWTSNTGPKQPPFHGGGAGGGGHPPEPGHSWRRMFSGQMRRSQRISAQGTKGWREGYERGSEGGWCCWLHNVRNVFNNTELHASEWSRQ